MHNIDKFTKSHQAISKTISFATIRDLITDSEVQAPYRQLGYMWRQRLLPPPTMVRWNKWWGINGGNKNKK